MAIINLDEMSMTELKALGFDMQMQLEGVSGHLNAVKSAINQRLAKEAKENTLT
jgi:hypothetical protein